MVLIGQEPLEPSAAASEGPEPAAVPPAPPAPEPSVAGNAPKGRNWILIGGIAAALVAVIVVEFVLLLSAQSNENNLKALDSARTSALAAARTYSVEIASYNYRTLQQDFQKVEQHATPSFQAQYSQSSKALTSVLTAYHAVATATVLAAGLQSATTSKAVAVVFLNQTVSNTTQKKPTTDQSRVEITMLNQKGQWLIDQLNLV